MALKELNVETLIGEDLAKAKKLIFSSGWRFRVIREDGKDYQNSKTSDIRPDRVNLTVASGVITDAKVG